MLKTRKNILPYTKGHSTYYTNLAWVETQEFRSLLLAAVYHSPVAAQGNRNIGVADAIPPPAPPPPAPADTPLLSGKVLFLHSSH